MKKPQNRFIEEIEKDSAGSFAGSSENRSSGAGVAGIRQPIVIQEERIPGSPQYHL